jgi:hypothetical protein
VPGEDKGRVLDRMQRCIAAVKDWMAMNRLKLNDDKTEFMVLGSPCNLAKTCTEYIVVGDHKITKSQHVRKFGAMIGSTADESSSHPHHPVYCTHHQSTSSLHHQKDQIISHHRSN